MPRTLSADLALDAGAELGEGPLWDAQAGVLSWVDLLAGRVHLCDADGRLLRTHALEAPVGAALPAAGGGYLLGDGTGLTLLGDDGGTTPVLEMFDATATPRQRCNDAKCDPAGRAWVGTVAR